MRRDIVVRSGKLELGQSHQDMGRARLELKLLHQAQRVLRMTQRIDHVTLLEHEHGQVVLGSREHPLIVKRLVDRYRPV